MCTPKNRKKRSFHFAALLIAAACAGIVRGPMAADTLAVAGSSGVLARDVPAAGRHEVVLNVKKWGRYSLACSGERPVSLSIADRRNGVISRDGEAGQRNPRIDLFLDLGAYKLATHGTKKAAGTTKVTASPFAYPAGFKPSRLVPLRENALSLDDLQQTAFWFEVASDTTVYIEAAGRNLADLALWRDGEWLVKAETRSFTAKPKEETPLMGMILTARIPKGAYMAAAYGGKGRDWSAKGGEHPFFIRLGMESLAANIASVRTVPAQGYSQVLLAPGVTHLVVEGPDKSRLLAELNRLDRDFAPAGWMATDSIHGKLSTSGILLAPQAVPEEEGYRVLKISGAPGQVFTLRTFGGNPSLSGRQGRSWWFSTQHSGNHRDGIGASGLVVDRSKGSIVALQADTVSADRELAKRFNLLSKVDAFVWVGADGKYSVTPGGAAATWRLGRYFYVKPPGYAEPAWNDGARTLELNQGLYLLEMDASRKGIATMVVRKTTLLGGAIAAGKAVLGSGDDRAWNAPRPSLRFSGVPMGPHDEYAFVFNSQAPELTSAVVRPSPIDPDLPLGLWCAPGETVRIPVRLAGRRRLTVTDARGAPAPFEADGKRYDKGADLQAGDHNLAIAGQGTEPRFLALQSLPPEMLSSGPLPAFPDAERAALPKFPPLEAGKTAFLDLDRRGKRNYALRVAEPGLYRIETTGRMATGLSLSDRFLQFNRTANANGVGRNALLIEYLLPGEYQVTAEAMGQSAGHLGLAAYRNALLHGGLLEPDFDNRKSVAAYSGVEYALSIPAAGKYSIHSLGQKGDFPIRLEDKDGWPLEPALSAGPMTLALPKGSFRLISMPAAQEGRRIARLVPIAEKRAIKGKGPHPLPLNTVLASTWVEKGGKGQAPGAPALFMVSLPAPVSARLTVTKGFQAVLRRAGEDSALSSWRSGRKRDLAAGSYVLSVTPDRKKNHAPYQVSIATRALLPGLSYDLRKKETLAVSLGSAGIVELGSQGTLDVTATLLEADGKTVIAANDDGLMDWNFSISRALKAGRYFLRVESAEPEFSTTTVFMRALADSAMDTLSAQGSGREGASAPARFSLNRRMGVFPLALADDGDILAFSASGKDRIGFSLESSGSDADQWVAVAQQNGHSPFLAVPRSADRRYRLKVWSESGGDGPIELAYANPSARTIAWGDAVAGVSGRTLNIGGARAWYKIDLGNHAPGHFRAGADGNPLAGIGVSTAGDSAFEEESADWFASNERFAWVGFRFDREGKYEVKLDAMRLEPGRPVTVSLAGGRPRVFGTRLPKGSVALFTAEADGYHPLAALSPAVGSGNAPLRVRGVAADPLLWMGTGRSASVALSGGGRDGEGRAMAWNALPLADGSRPSVRLAWNELPESDGGDLASGLTQWKAGKASARVFRIAPKKGFRVKVTLPPASAALLRNTDGSGTLECSFGGEPVVREFSADGGELHLLALSGGGFDITAFSLGETERTAIAEGRTLAAGVAWQARMAREGSTLLPLGTGSPGTSSLHYRGSARGADWIGGDGLLRPDLANGASVGPGGFLKLDHGTGWARLDLCGGSSPAEVMGCKWGASLVPSGSAAIAQGSQVRLRDGVMWFTFALKDTQHVNLSASPPLSAILLRDGAPSAFQEAWESFNWDLPLAPGTYFLGVHPLAGTSLEGAPLSLLFRPIGHLSEKRPAEAYLSPGESRLFAFDISKKSVFGIGMRMDQETAEARVYDGQGRLAGQGKQQFLPLGPGRHYLWLRVPEGAEGTRITAYLFGQEPPPDDPPERMIKWILSGAEGPRPGPEADPETDLGQQKPAWERFIRPEYEDRAYEGGESRDGGGDGGESAQASGEEHASGEEEGGDSGEGGAEEEDGGEAGNEDQDASQDGNSEGE